MGNLSVAEKVNVKSKNLDVLSEYKKSNRKKSANFVVIGLFFLLHGYEATLLTLDRPC